MLAVVGMMEEEVKPEHFMENVNRSSQQQQGLGKRKQEDCMRLLCVVLS